MDWNRLNRAIDAAGETGMHAVELSALNAVVYTFTVSHMSIDNDAKKLTAEYIAGDDVFMAKEVAFTYAEAFLHAHGVKWDGMTIENIHRYNHGSNPESWHVCFTATVYVREEE